MNDFVTSVIREVIQKGLAVVALWLLAHGIDLPPAVSNWIVLTTVALAAILWTMAVRFLETRKSPFLRGLAKLLMLGLSGKGKQPVYANAQQEATNYLRARQTGATPPAV